MKINKKIISLTLVITMLLSATLIVNARISEEKTLAEYRSLNLGVISGNQAQPDIGFTEQHQIFSNFTENSSEQNNENDTWIDIHHTNETEINSGANINYTDPEEINNNETEPPSDNSSIYEKPVLELFTIQNKGFNRSVLGVKETRWLNDTSLLVNVGVSVNCARQLKKGAISLENYTLKLKYEITGEEGVMYRCQGDYDLYYIISNIEQKDFMNIELVPILNLQ